MYEHVKELVLKIKTMTVRKKKRASTVQKNVQVLTNLLKQCHARGCLQTMNYCIPKDNSACERWPWGACLHPKMCIHEHSMCSWELICFQGWATHTASFGGVTGFEATTAPSRSHGFHAHLEASKGPDTSSYVVSSYSELHFAVQEKCKHPLAGWN